VQIVQVKLTVSSGPHVGKEFVFEGHDTFLVGRSKDAHFRFSYDDPYFSRRHFMIEVNPPRCRILDLKSRNGVRVNGSPVSIAALKHGDEIQAGHTTLAVTLVGDDVGDHATIDPSKTESPSPYTVDLATRGDSLSADLMIPGYRLEREIGRGGLGVVYRARREADGQHVAVKVITTPLGANQKQIARFLRESQILGDLKHRRIVSFIESGRVENALFLAMELLHGPDLGKLLEQKGPQPVAAAVRMICQAITGIEHAHSRGYVHRDLKPSNFLLGSSGGKKFVKVADFGLSRAYQNAQLSGLTMQGEVGGTPEFMAPEQITHFRDAKPVSDQYALAATLYALLTKRYVHDFPKSTGEKLVTILTQTPVPIRERCSDIPEELADVIMRALSRETENRFDDLTAFRSALLPFA
jgi:eukaryotic-like serine/threonine-protein kinase